MKARALSVGGAWEFEPEVFPDDRGLFVSPFQHEVFAEAVGAPLFAVAQASASVSRRGVARGVHYARTAPGCAKYVTCSRGRVLDIVVDLRVGSPTFGEWDSVELAGDGFRAVYLPPGLGHAFIALDDHSTVHYLLSRAYEPADELAVSIVDPDLALPVPAGTVLSERDRVAPGLVLARDNGLLPVHAA
jgi:5-epimerase